MDEETILISISWAVQLNGLQQAAWLMKIKTLKWLKYS